MSENIQRVLVWPPILRVLHLMMAATVITLTVTGILLNSGMILNEALYLNLLRVWHIPAGHVLLLVLLVRILLLVLRKDVAGWRALIPESFDAVIRTATFYLSLARMHLPAYFAHNPLWKIIYLVWMSLLLLQALTGLLLESAWLRSVFRTDSASMLDFHQLLLEPLTVLLVAHVISVMLHDWKTDTGEISAINNGYKFFSVTSTDKTQLPTSPVSISIKDLTAGKTPDKLSQS